MAQGPSKRPRLSGNNREDYAPLGLIWDGTDFSCAYDAAFTILLHIWRLNPVNWSIRFSSFSPFLDILAKGFVHMVDGSYSFENTRDAVRKALHQADNISFPLGNLGTNCNDLLFRCFKQSPYAYKYMQCPVCLYKDPVQTNIARTYNDIVHTRDYIYEEKSYTLEGVLELTQVHTMDKVVRIFDIPSVIILGISEECERHIVAPYIKIPFEDKVYTLNLRGIIYGGNYHFTSRIISPNGTIWFHDGITTKSACKNQGSIKHLSSLDWLLTCNEDGGQKKAITLIYAIR
ncbi:hypothetical protein BDZ94DRAFT_1162809 [Collybia nuda]|uniref:Uncharacterized protein n=1 Tax=Collybia nuda TaxID=64659 RepID=A0A9P5Y845_9AGAR|nr:hypothetical protein BDZ94DRAFT_1162809 [Collybia nuda]